jgi:hypothetical protein
VEGLASGTTIEKCQAFEKVGMTSNAVGPRPKLRERSRPTLTRLIEHRREILGTRNVDMLRFDLAVRT